MTIPAEFTAQVEQAAAAAGQSASQTVKDEGGTGEAAFVADPEENNDDGDPGVSGEGGGGDPGTGEAGGDNPSGEGEGGEVGGGGDGGDGTPAKPAVSSTALARAISAGLRVDEAIALGSDEAVNEIADRMDADREAAAVAEKAEAEAEAERERIAAERKTLADSMPELDPDETDPKVIEAFGKMKAQFEKQQEQLDAFEQRQAEQSQAAEAAQKREMTQKVESQFADLNKTFSEALGNDGWDAISLDSPKGDQIAGKMAVIIGGYNSQGLKAPSLEEVFADAARLVLKDDFTRAEEARLAKKVEKRNGMEINPPGGSKGKTEKSPIDATADLIDKQFFKR